jgi:deaminated glutathione amidase
MKIGAVQMVSGTEVGPNLETARRLVARAAAAGARLVVLPEYFCLMGRADRDKLAIAEAPGDGPIQAMLAETARAHGIWLVGGTLPIATANLQDRAVPGPRPEGEKETRSGPSLPGNDADRVLNANCVYAPDGTLAARYDKIHLFRYDNGRERYDEGAAIRAGNTPTSVRADGLRVGLSVCYDLRFPELYRDLVYAAGEPPCDLLSVPSAFTHTTGLAHWELLLRARAVENQCYVVAAAQGGLHENGRRTYGHSLVVDPWGKVLGVCEEGEGVVLAEVDPACIAQVRAQLPALAHSRFARDAGAAHG